MRTIHVISLVVLVAAAAAACDAAPTDEPQKNADEVAATQSADQTGKALTDSILAQWQRAHPDRDWQAEVRRSHPHLPDAADNSDAVGGTQASGETYGRFTEQDVLTWKREAENLVLEGARIFHSGDELGTTVAVSCDMCHPDAANTHPETYPKFQVQAGRVFLLRDMINWCLINPVRAEPFEPDDARMRALEAYILAQRKGTELNYGKH